MSNPFFDIGRNDSIKITNEVYFIKRLLVKIIRAIGGCLGI